jgi:hypothetical protein
MGGISISIFFKFEGIHNARSDGLDPSLSQSDFSRPAFRRSSIFPAFIGLFFVFVFFLRHIYIALHSLNERQNFSRSVCFLGV